MGFATVPSAKPASLSPEEIVAALNQQIEHYKALADGSHQLGAERDAAEAFAMTAKLRNVRDEFLSWLAARPDRRAPQTGQVLTFRRRSIAGSAG
jgi:hypothetical protein